MLKILFPQTIPCFNQNDFESRLCLLPPMGNVERSLYISQSHETASHRLHHVLLQREIDNAASSIWFSSQWSEDLPRSGFLYHWLMWHLTTSLSIFLSHCCKFVSCYCYFVSVSTLPLYRIWAERTDLCRFISCCFLISSSVWWNLSKWS